MAPVGSLGFLPFTRLEIKSAGPAELLSVRFVTGRRDERGKLRDGYFVSVHPKRLDCHFMDRRFVRHSVLRTHQEPTAFDEHHAVALNAITVTGLLIVRRFTG